MSSSNSYSTPAPKSKRNGGRTPYKTPSLPNERAKPVDLVTGKAIVEYFFDPLLIINENIGTGMQPFKTPSKRSSRKDDSDDGSDDSLLFNSKHLYTPCTIIKSLEENTDKGSKGKGSNSKKNKKRRATIQPVGGPALVKTRDGTLYKIRDATKLIALTSPDDYVGLNDVLHMANITESSLLHALRVRYKRDTIYTSAGPILISVNPYKPIITQQGESIYSEQTMLRYRTSANFSEEEPHLFQVADRAYSAMMDSVHIVPNLEDADADRSMESPKNHRMGSGQVLNQSIIISGESGAGKTEATKYIMKYLARITTKKNKWSSKENPPFLSPDGKAMATLEERVLSSNPLLETFGNAQTLRNDNSSRFGKYIHINFSTEKGIIMGARVSNYLLEKTRITTQIEGERNYHIFYQIFAGANPELLQELGLDVGTASFRYLGYRSSLKTESDKRNFVETMECLSNVGLATEERNTVMGMTAAVLHIGNISFEETDNDEDHSAVITEDSRPSLQKACALLGLKESDVADAILTKLLTINGKSIKKPSTMAMAEDKRDALAKMTYSYLFLWLVKSINITLSQHETDSFARNDAKQTGFIGVLDIYGFECFDVNGYEQLLINYCNEKLQRHFNRHVFEVEQKLYASEGVDWTYITFNDNQPCLELIEGGAGLVGILNTLDDSFSGMGSSREKDVTFVSQLHKLFGSVAGTKNTNGGHEYFVTPKFGNDRQFSISHYAGEVRYTVDGFVEKNMESTSNELKDLGSTSTISLARDVFGVPATNDDRRSSIRGFSVASQFKQSLQSLVGDLEMTQPHYIRCIKPNLKKASDLFNAGEVLKQLRYSGMMEAIRIRREGYALREDHNSFYNRFSVLLSADDLNGGMGIDQLVSVLSKRLNVSDADWQIGHSKIFLRRELSDKLERLAKLRVHRAARTLSRFGRLVASRRASILLVTWMKFRLSMMKKYKANKASSRIAATYRMYLQVKILKSCINAVVKIQSHQRKIAAKLVARRLRDPLCGMSHRELKELLRSETNCLENAIDSQDFKRAANIEEKVESIKIAIEERQPMTRPRLEEKIAAIEKRLDIVIQRKDYKEASPIQDELENLTILRKEYPTIDELKADVCRAEEAVAGAAKRRDFANAASLQLEMDNAKKRLNEALNEINESNEDPEQSGGVEALNISIDGIDSRADLESELTALHDQVEEAISKNDFQLALELQSKIDDKEKLRIFFPSVKELEDELRGAKKALEDAISCKDFGNASKLNDEISRLEQSVTDERERVLQSQTNTSDNDYTPITGLDGTEMVFESRHSLEKEIRSNVSLQASEVSLKHFKKAQEIQALIDRMEILRSNFPTVTELRGTISTKKSAMDTAISDKRFVDAEIIDKEICILELKLNAELEIDEPNEVSFNSISSNVAVRKAKYKSPTVTMAAPLKPSAISTASFVNTKKSNVKVVNDNRSVSSKSRSTDGRSDRKVSSLRPKKPLVSSVGDSVLSVTQMLASKRGSASLIVNDEGGLAGIITDTDITRRLVAKHLDAASTSVSKVMTPNPTCVSMLDSAMDAMTTMVENHFRHLPVVDDKGGVVGLLDIAKCLNDAISKLEKKSKSNSGSVAQSEAQEALSQAMQSQGAQGAQAAALQALLAPLMNQAFGNQASPTLRSLLAGKPSTVVQLETSVFEAGTKMAESRKAALVVEDGNLVGIFGFKDMMTRVVAKELPMDDTEISAVMTPNPESVSPDMTILEALQTMHDNKFLTLPVCEENGTVVGLVNVMDVIYGCGGVEGWRSIFSTSLELDDMSDEVSYKSGKGSTAGRSQSSRPRTVPINKSAKARKVSSLRPKKPLVSSVGDSVLSVTQMLASKRGSASLIVNDEGGLAGIITDTDITRRLVAKHLDAASTSVSKVMTPNPTCVSMLDSAMDAMTTMVENHFRHLPVVDDKGGVVGLLDIAKCLNDAISKLEKKSKSNSGSVAQSEAQEALSQAMQSQGAQGAQAAALQALLAPLMNQAFGNQASPTLRSLLAGKPSTVVQLETSVFEAGTKMAESRKAALVVEDGNLVGIFGFKDMMTRVVAKELPMDDTEISAVMTPNPESVSPDMTILEALQTMHDNKFLTLPVCEENGTVVGLVNVMDVIYGCGGVEGWRSIFSTSLELDDMSDEVSYKSGKGSTAGRSQSSRPRTVPINKSAKARKVSSLRPKKPLVSSVGDSVLSVTQMLASKRGSASLIVNDEGGLAGIITDTDITRRLVAKHLDAASTSVSKVMTPNPTCVSMLDSAMDAMTTMVENHFRHLPVVDDKGGVVGLLDIAKCLNDAISKLEKKSKSNSGSVAQSEAQEALSQAMQSQGAQGAQAAALQALLAPLMNQAFGNQASPTLRSLLAGKPSTVVQLETSVFEAGTKMAESRKAALVVEDGNLVGIFGFKDMMTRVVAKELPMDDTEISAVMTPNPESVSPDMTILEALQTMHDNKFLTLPVCEENGTVVGLVNVMDVIYGCGGVEGWRSIFTATLDLDDLSETASHASGRSNAVEAFTSGPSKSSAKAIELNKTVMNLRPKKPQISSVDESILAVTKKLAINRSDSAILVDSNGELTGIITDTDITRRVVSKGLDTTKTCISVVMTPDPKFVNHNDSAMDAMMLMIEHRFRHLPVVNGKDVVGTLDIARCLNDAISKLERSVSTKSNAAEQLMKKAIESTGGADAASLEALLYPLLNKALGANSAVPSLRSITHDTYCAIVRPETSVLDVASAMTESRKAALVVDEGQLVGIFGFKDMMTRVVAAELDQASTAVSMVMTPDPEFAEPEMNAIEALKMMHDNKFLTLPIVAEDGSVVGVVDVMDVIHACGGPDHWRSIFEVALRLDDASVNESVINSVATPPVKNKVPMIKVSKNAPMVSSSPPPLGNIPSTLEFQKGSNEEFDETTFNDTYRMETASFLSDGNVVVFKIVDPDGHTHRLHSELKIVCLRKAFVDKLAGRLKATNISFKFFDEEGDAILISTDEDLAEAVTLARNASNGSKVVVKLTAEVKKGDSNGSESILLVGIGIAVVAIAVGASMILSSKPTTTPSRY